MAKRLTDRSIANLKPSADVSTYHFDSAVSGLAVRVYPSGVRSFIFDWREHRRQRRVTIGKFPSWTIGKARAHASRLRLKADVGDSVTPRRGERVADLLVQWRAVVELTRRPRTASHYIHMVERHILPAFGQDAPRAIGRNAIERWHGRIAQRTPILANRALAVLSAFLSWCEHDNRITSNPAKGIRKRPENHRHVFLDAKEIAAAYKALDADSDRRAALALKLALLTGARIGEVLNLAPEQIDVGRRIWIKPSSHTKSKKTHVVPLQGAALAVAQELGCIERPDYRACRQTWARVRAIIVRTDVVIHDLRHSRASALARNGASLLQIGKVLGHAAAATSARYAHLIDSDLVDLVERT